ncbi:tetratricopeptide repeat protein [Candidatus Micrarchaeota archaeon]|nr:tetratricopeptide repeat protein [Candidatus Micrarchaeota archaeon]
MNDVGKILAGKNFASEKEANAYLEKIMNSDEFPQFKRTPLDEAQELMYGAWESTGKKRVKLAFEALKISADCADAHVLLAEEALKAGGLEEAKILFQHSVEAGERAIGKDAFINGVGHFWGLVETRPYMRARLGLAQVLETLGLYDQARMHYADMLRLNPNDNQGVRYLLANCLFALGRDGELGELFQKYGDESSADWGYSRALWAFRAKNGKAPKYLKDALESNRHVPDYLLGVKRIPSHLPQYITLGETDEAVSYAASSLDFWQNTPGALDWLAEAIKPAKL